MPFLYFLCDNLYKRCESRFKVWKSEFFLLLSIALSLIVFGINMLKDLECVIILMFIAAFFALLIVLTYVVFKLFNENEQNAQNMKLFPVFIFLAITIIFTARTFTVIVIPYNKAKQLYDKDHIITGKIISFISETNDDAAFSNELLGTSDEADENVTNAKNDNFILMKTEYGAVSFYCSSKELHYGDEIKLNMHFMKPSPQRNPGGFDENKYCQANGIYLKGSLINGREPEVTNRTRNIAYISASFARAKIQRIFMKNLPLREAGLMAGLLLGDRSKMMKDDLTSFKKAGLSHITAVSGSAITFLLLPLRAIFRKVKVPKKIKSAIIFIVLIFFGFLTGWSPSITRALLMVFILIFSMEMHKKITVIQALFIALSVLLIFKPIFALDFGFWLSVMATAGIVQLSGSIEKTIMSRHTASKAIGSVLSTGIAAGLSVLPFAVWISKEISFSSILSNLIILPVVGLTTILGSIQTFAGMLNENYFLTNLLAIPLKGLLFFIYYFADIISGIDFLHIKTDSFSFFIFLSICVFIIFIFVKDKNKKKLCRNIAICFLSAGILHTFMIRVLQPEIRIVFADVGQGDATLIMLKSGESILIDSGGKVKGTPVMNQMLDYYDIDHPSVYIATHTHEDHCGGIIELIREKGGDALFVPYGTIGYDLTNGYDPGLKDEGNERNEGPKKRETDGESNLAGELLEIADKENLLVKEAGENDVIKFNDKFSITFYNPEKAGLDSDEIKKMKQDYVSSQITKSENDSCLVLKIEYDNYKLLIMGDASGDTEKKLIDKGYDIASDIYRISHHGSPSSTNHDIISAVSPRVSIISVGKNFYGHPSPKVINRLLAAGGEILRTDMNGAILVEINNKKLQINTMIQ